MAHTRASDQTDWKPCLGYDDLAMRMTRTFLTTREGYLLVSDGNNVARVKGVGPNAHTTGRAGVKIDVTPEPHNQEDTWNHAIFLAQAVRMLRGTDAIPDEDSPLVYWFKQIEPGYVWEGDRPPGAVPPHIITQEEIISEEGAVAPESLWTLAVKGLKSSVSAGSAVLTVLIFRHHKAVALPLLIGGASSYVARAYDQKDGWASMAVEQAAAIAVLKVTCSWIQKVVVWILCAVFLLRILYIAWRVIRLLNQGVRWMESGVEPSEVDSVCSSPPRPQVPLTPNPGNSQDSEGGGTIEQDERADVPDVELAIDPVVETANFSPAPTSDMGDGVFSSVSSARRCVAVDETAGSAEQDEGDTCLAHNVFPADGFQTPLDAVSCRADITEPVSILGDEMVMVNGAPQRTPCLGGSLPLCSFHDNVYQLRAEGARCYRADCMRRGFPWSGDGPSRITCAYRLQQQLTKPPLRLSLAAAPVFVVPADGEGGDQKIGVSWQQPSLTEPDDDKELEVEEAISPSSRSESWSSQEEEIKKIFGDCVRTSRSPSHRDKRVHEGERRKRLMTLKKRYRLGERKRSLEIVGSVTVRSPQIRVWRAG